MSEKKKSRRRFLADMLFLGGAAGAAAFLAQSKFSDKEPEGGGCELEKPKHLPPRDIEPVPAGAAPAHLPPEDPAHLEGDVVQPQADGNMVLPEQAPPSSDQVAPASSHSTSRRVPVPRGRASNKILKTY